LSLKILFKVLRLYDFKIYQPSLKRSRPLIINASQEIEDLKKKVDSLDIEIDSLSKKKEKLKSALKSTPPIQDTTAYANNVTAWFKNETLSAQVNKKTAEKRSLSKRIMELTSSDLFKEKDRIEMFLRKRNIRSFVFGVIIDKYLDSSILNTECFWQSLVYYYLERGIRLGYINQEVDFIEQFEELLKLLIWRISNTKQMLEGLDEAQKQEAKLLIGQFTLAKDYMQDILIKLQEDNDGSNND
jgi:prefoldin subunit 5